MIRTEGRLDVRLISPTALRQFMEHHGYTIRGLANATNLVLARNRRNTAHVSHSTIGHLLTGERKSCKPEVARAIAKVLNAPVDSLFASKVSYVSRDVAGSKRAAA